jgi:hypothetical protein
VAAITTIVVPDAAATPVNHTFNPVRIDGDTATWLEKSSGSATGFWPLVTVLRAPLAGQTEKLYRFTLKLAIPVTTVETINGVARTALLYTLRANVDMTLPADATLQNRKDLRKILTGILADSSIVDQVENLNNAY